MDETKVDPTKVVTKQEHKDTSHCILCEIGSKFVCCACGECKHCHQLISYDAYSFCEKCGYELGKCTNCGQDFRAAKDYADEAIKKLTKYVDRRNIPDTSKMDEWSKKYYSQQKVIDYYAESKKEAIECVELAKKFFQENIDTPLTLANTLPGKWTKLLYNNSK